MALRKIPLADGVWCVDHATSIGVVERDGRAFLVDAGLDDNLVRKVVNDLGERRVKLEAILVTHAHADHFGGVPWAVARTGSKVFAPRVDEAFLREPTLEPWTLWGSTPPPGMSDKFLQGPATPVHAVVSDGEWVVAGVRVALHALPGHTPGQIGVGVDDVLFAGDALLGESVLAKHPVPFSVDPDQMRASCREVPQLGYATVHVAHGGRVSDAAALAETNVRALDAAETAALDALAEPTTTEDAFARVAARWPEPPHSPGQWTLDHASFRATVAALARRHLVRCELVGTRLLWRRG